jgi:ribosomal protein S18 acetylase RimI-like enzyme
VTAGGFRSGVEAADPARIRALVDATGFFSAEEAAIAAELAAETLATGGGAGYSFWFADGADGLDGFSCFGRIPGSDWSFDLYWIVVSPACQGAGLGRRLLAATEAAVSAAGGGRLYVDTSSRRQYAPTRAFYLACGYAVAAELPDFYRAGDGKVVFVKELCG